MKKSEFIDVVAEKTGLSKKDAKVSVESVLDAITETLQSGDSVNFIGFGTFSTAIRAARDTKVPGTDRIVHIKETRVAKFKVGKQLKEAVANREEAK